MHTNFQEVSALYHYGIKGMKWGIINEKDNQETRLASEKNRLDYERKISLEKEKNERELALAKLDSETAIELGKQELKKSFSQDYALRKQSADERKAKEKKYKMIGSAAIIAALTTMYIVRRKSKESLASKEIDKGWKLPWKSR